MLHRWTLWETERGEPLQLSLALLSDVWEPVWESTVQCGPFTSAEDARLRLLDDLRRWVRTNGIQLELL